MPRSVDPYIANLLQALRIKLLACLICPMFNGLRTSSGNSRLITRFQTKTEGPDSDTPASEAPSLSPVNLTTTTDSESREFIQVRHECTWSYGLLVREVAQGLVLMARAEGDKATKFCTVFRVATWSKPTFSRHQAMWRGLSSNESEAALRLPNYMWKDLAAQMTCASAFKLSEPKNEVHTIPYNNLYILVSQSFVSQILTKSQVS